jgi:hypothetical protein
MFASWPNRCFSPVPLGVGDKEVEFDNCIELAVGPYRDARPYSSAYVQRQIWVQNRVRNEVEKEQKEKERQMTRTRSIYGDGDNGERVLGKVECVLLLGRSSNLLSLPLLVGGLGVVANEVELPAGGWGGYAIVYGTFDDGVIEECNVCKG